MNKIRQNFRRFLQDFYLVLIMLFLYAPIATMVVLSFNSSKSRTQWGGFTLQWYTQMFASRNIMAALQNTLLIAFLSALIATIIGTAASIAISSMKQVPQTIVMGITNIPMLNADIVTGISLMLAFIAFGVSLGFKTVLIAHITFNIPYVILSVMPKLKQTNRFTYEAALDLGASRSVPSLRWCSRIFYRACFPAFCWPSPCPWMISSSPTSPEAPASTPCPP